MRCKAWQEHPTTHCRTDRRQSGATYKLNTKVDRVERNQHSKCRHTTKRDTRPLKINDGSHLASLTEDSPRQHGGSRRSVASGIVRLGRDLQSVQTQQMDTRQGRSEGGDVCSLLQFAYDSIGLTASVRELCDVDGGINSHEALPSLATSRPLATNTYSEKWTVWRGNCRKGLRRRCRTRLSTQPVHLTDLPLHETSYPS